MKILKQKFTQKVLSRYAIPFLNQNWPNADYRFSSPQMPNVVYVPIFDFIAKISDNL